jgi:chromosome segregation ATPase
LNAAQAGKNQEVLAKVKARLLNQNQVLQHNAGELEKTQKQLADQAKLCEEARQQSGQLKAQYTAAEHRWVQEREKISQQVKALSAEAVLLKQQIQTLQLKSVSDDQAIAELSALLTGDAAPSAPTRTETAEAA